MAKNAMFSAKQIKNTVFKNRVVMAPMCMYSSDDNGEVKTFHKAHYTARAIGGVGSIIIEATGVARNGRISAGDLGIWSDNHIKGLSELVADCKSVAKDIKMGIQLAHAGRKCTVFSEDIVGPSPFAFDDKYKLPRALDEQGIASIVNEFANGAKRAVAAGFDFVEIHAAHGYLLSQFLSPLSNKRTDSYSGANHASRSKILAEVVTAIRKVIPADMPVFVRVSATDYTDGGNHPEDLAKILNLVKNLGVDVAHISSGGVAPANIVPYPGYHINAGITIKKEAGLPVVVGGAITNPEFAEFLISSGNADFVFLARELLRNPNWPLNAAKALKEDDAEVPVQYTRAYL